MSCHERRLISVIAPVFNEAGNVRTLLDRLSAVAANESQYEWEFIFVDDGSSDETPRILTAAAEQDPRVKLLQLTRNFGHQIAITAGLTVSRGAATITMDGDLQHPPELLPEFLRRWEEGAEVVVGVRNATAGGRGKRWTSRGFYWLINKCSEVPILPGGADFRLMSRRVVGVFVRMPERVRFIRGLVSWMGFDVQIARYDEEPRASGASKYSIGRMLFLATDAITSFSALPLRFATVAGLFVCCGAALYAAFTLLAFFFWPDFVVPGWTSIILIVLFLGGIQLLFLGIVGEYIHRIFDEIKNRPLFLVKRAVGFEAGRLDERESRHSDRGFAELRHADWTPDRTMPAGRE